MSEVVVELFDETGVTKLAVLDTVRGVTWQDELSKPGNATFEIPVDDPKAALITDRRIVKFSVFGAIRFACVITSETCDVAIDGDRRWLRYETQPGVGSILARAVVFPEYGLTRRSGDDRLFGFMSKIGPGPTSWYVPTDWTAPVASYTWADDQTIRKGYPPVFATIDKRAQWIAPAPGPDGSAVGQSGGFSAAVLPARTVAYYRDTFTVKSETPVTIYVSADAYLTLYLDGEVVISPDYTSTIQWTTAQTVVTTLAPGSHIMAARVENATGGGPLAFIASVVYLSDTGQPGEATETETLSGDVLFAFGSDELNAAARAAVDAVTDEMTGDAPKVKVVGHTDNVGSTGFNQALSERRADAVADRIRSRKPGAVVTTSGKGETQPVATNETAAGRAKNRRVTITYTHATEATTTPGDTQTVTVVRRTDAKWKVHLAKPVPGWHRASVLRRLAIEAGQRTVAGFGALTVSYDDELDSSGRAWTDLGEYSFPVATLSVLEVAQQLAEAEMDFGVDPDGMTLDAWRRRGEDRATGSDAVALWTGGNLKAYETSRTSALVTAIVSRLSDGAWQETKSAAGIAAAGRIEIGLTLGSTLDPASASNVARSVLAEAAQSALVMTGETTTLSGPQPYRDYGIGDTVAVPGHRGTGRARARVMAISVDASAETLRAWPELVLDLSASTGIAGPGGAVWTVYGEPGGQLTASLAPPGAKLSTVTFEDGATAWKLTVGDGETLVLTTTPSGIYTQANPYVVPSSDPDVLLDVWVDDGFLITRERAA